MELCTLWFFIIMELRWGFLQWEAFTSFPVEISAKKIVCLPAGPVSIPRCGTELREYFLANSSVLHNDPWRVPVLSHRPRFCIHTGKWMNRVSFWSVHFLDSFLHPGSSFYEISADRCMALDHWSGQHCGHHCFWSGLSTGTGQSIAEITFTSSSCYDVPSWLRNEALDANAGYQQRNSQVALKSCRSLNLSPIKNHIWEIEALSFSNALHKLAKHCKGIERFSASSDGVFHLEQSKYCLSSERGHSVGFCGGILFGVSMLLTVHFCSSRWKSSSCLLAWCCLQSFCLSSWLTHTNTWSQMKRNQTRERMM